MKTKDVTISKSTRVLNHLRWKTATIVRTAKHMDATSELVAQLIRQFDAEIKKRDRTIRVLQKENDLLRAGRNIPATAVVPTYTFKVLKGSPTDILKMDAREILPLPESLNEDEIVIFSRLLGAIRQQESRHGPDHCKVANLIGGYFAGVGTKTQRIIDEACFHFKLSRREARVMLGYRV